MQNKYSTSFNTPVEDKRVSISNLICAIISWIITVVWMLEIFNFSAETGDESSFRSQELLIFLHTKLNLTFLDEVLLRNMAHVTEFALLTLISFIAISFSSRIIKNEGPTEYLMVSIKSENEMCILSSLWISSLFAILDEYHQLFVIGRSGSIIDVCIDMIGIVVVLLIIRIAFSIKMIYLNKTL